MSALSIKEKIKFLPESPGIYQYFDEGGKILYVGKAKNLKKRVSSYFSKVHDVKRTRVLVSKIRDIKYLVVATEQEALLLENSLIKKYQPRYNILLKDDKTYPWICVTNEEFPRVFPTRSLIKDGSQYFGPYANVKIMHTLLELIRELYPLRTCRLDLTETKIQEGRFKVCLEYHIGKCKGPCEGYEDLTTYREYIQEVKSILSGAYAPVISVLKAKMNKAAEAYLFEEAHFYKKRLLALESFKNKSTVVSTSIKAVDVIGALDMEDSVFINYLVVYDGAIIHGLTIEVKRKLEERLEDIMAFVWLEMKEKFKSRSREIISSHAFDLEFDQYTVSVPQRGDKKHLVDLSIRNAKYYQIEQNKRLVNKNPEIHTDRILNQMKNDLQLSELPIHIECFDNSNIQGTNPVSACVVFKNAKPSKKDYRHFNVKTVEGPDDFATMEEAVYRRYHRLLDEGETLPQLIIIDGGKGQLGAALKALDSLGIRGKVAIIGIAKRLEEIFFPGDSLPIYLDKRSETLKVIQYLRNEAHRFGITHHRNRRSKNAFVSELTTIKGVGSKTMEDLVKQFKSVSKIKEASLESLAAVVGKAKAKLVYDYFHVELSGQ